MPAHVSGTKDADSSNNLPTLHFVIVCAGGDHADLRALLDSLAASRAEGSTYKQSIYVVENSDSPADADLSTLCAKYPANTLLHPGQNLGYGAGINFGVNAIPNHAEDLSSVAAHWVIICNADLVFPAGSVDELSKILAANNRIPNSGLVAPHLMDPMPPNESTADAANQPSIGRFPTLAGILAGKLKTRRTRKYISTPLSTTNIDWATGACLAVRLDAFRSISGFDESFFLDCEDVDLCRRLADAGWKRSFEPHWQVIHSHPHAQRAAPNPQRLRHTRASLVRYLAKHRPRWELHALGFLLRLAIALRSKNHPMQPAWQAGYQTYRQLRASSSKD